MNALLTLVTLSAIHMIGKRQPINSVKATLFGKSNLEIKLVSAFG